MSQGKSPSQHPDAGFLLDYAAGTLPAPFEIAIASHIALCPQCRAEVHRLEAVAGTAMADLVPAKVAPGLLDTLLSRLDDEAQDELTVARRSAAPPDALPQPLRDLVGEVDGKPWKSLGPIAIRKLEGWQAPAHAYLMRIKGGAPMPRHTHHGVEMTLVLDGGFTDGETRFERGDLALADPGIVHKPVADPEGCLCLAVTDRPLRMPGPISSLVARWFGV